MSEAEAVTQEDRLPWLGEEVEPPREHRTRDAIGLAIVAALLIFGVSYWIASQNWQRERAQREAATMPPAAVPLPKAPPRPRVAVRQPHRRIGTAPTQRLAENEATRAAPKTPSETAKTVAAPTTSEVVKAVAANEAPKAAKPVAESSGKQLASGAPPGSTGRLVRIGTFASPFQAKLGWRSMVRAYPALVHLPAVVVATGKSQASYRFQIGTSSQANSELLCQHMQRINYSCGIVGAGWKSRAAEQ